MKNLPKLIISIVVCELVGLLGTPFTVSAIPTWYTSLTKPSFAPPNWLFGPVWTTLYFLMGIAFYLIWKQGWHKPQIKAALKVFLIQLALNFLWTPVFFGLKSLLLGLVVIISMWFSIFFTLKKFYPLTHLGFYLLLPYFLWVSFASLLNATIVFLNRI